EPRRQTPLSTRNPTRLIRNITKTTSSRWRTCCPFATPIVATTNAGVSSTKRWSARMRARPQEREQQVRSLRQHRTNQRQSGRIAVLSACRARTLRARASCQRGLTSEAATQHRRDVRDVARPHDEADANVCRPEHDAAHDQSHPGADFPVAELVLD